ncbi:Enoyl-(acyl-carrier-protein) reductase [Candidatus Terasakiella magnetica]|uniref:Enoyl-(Acyl-carrier-protein) reductase n=1 Tax=Candidatus Terasakiella magnetica TaxID=1867952 RepID=A0A1C3RFM6_9PROT|nr:nitronate monooxygenase [Candidatus Terasakiella magnetica]SCA56069.1 Enoyl-(acyl-carrier-protein) reductase [Candidatus Terasakiella magnetica]
MMSEAAKQNLDKLWQRGKDFLGCEYAILGGAMSWISERNLVSALSNAGGFGVIAGGSMGPDLLSEEIAATKALTDKPFGVNLITMHPQLDELIDVCKEHAVSHVVLAGGLPSAASIKQAKDFGAKVICFSPALVLAKRLIRNGADALVIEGAEAGGHIGPVVTSVLAQEILPVIKDVPIFVAGGIGRGEAMLSYLEMGAAGVQMGTRFVCAEECIAHENFKKAFIRAGAKDAMTTVQIDPNFPVIPVRALNNKGTEEFMKTQRAVIEKFNNGDVEKLDGQLEIEHFWAGALKKAAIDGDVEFGSVMAGQSVGMVKKEQPISEILEELVDQACAVLETR